MIPNNFYENFQNPGGTRYFQASTISKSQNQQKCHILAVWRYMGFFEQKKWHILKFWHFEEFLSKFKVLYFEMSFQFPPGFFSFRSLLQDHQQFL